MLSPTGDAEEEYLPLRTTPTSARRALTPTGTGGVSAARRSGAQSDAWVEKSYSRFSSANCAWEIF